MAPSTRQAGPHTPESVSFRKKKLKSIQNASEMPSALSSHTGDFANDFIGGFLWISLRLG